MRNVAELPQIVSEAPAHRQGEVDDALCQSQSQNNTVSFPNLSS